MHEMPIDQPPPVPSGKKRSPYQADRLRGAKEARTQIEVLKAKWPAMFNDPKNVRPLAGSVAGEIAAALGWTRGYARGVMLVWKSRKAYCRAILCYSVRINLDGSPSEDPVNDRDRELAKAQLEQIAVREARKRDRELARRAAEIEALAPALATAAE